MNEDNGVHEFPVLVLYLLNNDNNFIQLLSFVLLIASLRQQFFHASFEQPHLSSVRHS